MAIIDEWQTADNVDDDGDNNSGRASPAKVRELDFDVDDWPTPQNNNSSDNTDGSKSQKLVQYSLRLEDCSHVPVDQRIQCHERNVQRLEAASKRTDIVHLEVPYSAVCANIVHKKLESLVGQDDRTWASFSLFNVHRMDDLYAQPVDGGKVYTVLSTMSKFTEVHLKGCPTSQGHGLDAMLKAIPHYDNLQTLHIEGWQLDRVSATSLVEALMWQRPKTITALSLRSCRFVGEGTFYQIVHGLTTDVHQLRILNLSYCGLTDHSIVPFIDMIRQHPNLRQLHLGGNTSMSQQVVTTLADWIQDPQCKLINLNLRALWIGFSEEGLLQRTVSLEPLFNALRSNTTLTNLTLSENYLEDRDMIELSNALSNRPSNKLHHLDVAGNPFGETAAKNLGTLLRCLKSIVSIRFENDVLPPYECAELLRFLARINHVEKKLRLASRSKTKLQIWPRAFAKVQESEDYTVSSSSSVMFHLLRSTMGPHGKELSMQIAAHICQG